MIRRIKKHTVLILSTLLFSCYGANKETSEISDLGICCNDKKETWPIIFEKYNVEKSEDGDLQEILKKFKSQIHKTDVIYFKDYPSEYIGISENRMLIRYVYNRKITNNVLSGLSVELSDSEKLRISLRVIALQMSNLDEEGRKETAKIIKRQCEDFLKNSEK